MSKGNLGKKLNLYGMERYINELVGQQKI
jgi:hypothetical protein